VITGGPVQRPGSEQQPDVIRCQEQPAGARGHRQAGQDDLAAPQVVRHRPEHQQGGKEQYSVGGEEQQEQNPGHQPERGSPRQRFPPGGAPGSCGNR
jgi:hypothetical protein